MESKCICTTEWRAHTCEVHVPCYEDCKALMEPKSNKEILSAYEHWRYHSSTVVKAACSHGY